MRSNILNVENLIPTIFYGKASGNSRATASFSGGNIVFRVRDRNGASRPVRIETNGRSRISVRSV